MKNKYDIFELGFIPPAYGGVSVSIERLIYMLEKDGYKTGGFYTHEQSDPAILKSANFYPELSLSTKLIVFQLPKFWKILKPYKVIHSHYSLEHMIYIWFSLVFFHKKVVVTVHNSMVEHFYKQCDCVNRFFLKKVAVHPNANWISVSTQARTKLENLPVSFRNPINVIPAYIPNIREVANTLSKDFWQYVQSHDKIITFYGHSFMKNDGEDVYGFYEALDLYARLIKHTDNNIGFLLCLSVVDDSRAIADLHQRAISLGVDDLIYWQLGPIKNMNEIWSQTDVYIRPTSTDGDSVAIREALDMGVQVVASDVCERPSKCVVYNKGNICDFMEKVVRSLSIGHQKPNPDFMNYEKIKSIYQKLLTE